MDADGQNQTNLTNHPAFDVVPDWQPLVTNRPPRLFGGEGQPERAMAARSLPAKDGHLVRRKRP